MFAKCQKISYGNNYIHIMNYMHIMDTTSIISNSYLQIMANRECSETNYMYIIITRGKSQK